VQSPRVLARIGGAEFAVLLPDSDAQTAVVAAQQLQAAVSGSLNIDSLEVETTALFGIASYPCHGDQAELLLQRTNVAISQAADSPYRIASYDRERDPFQPQRLTLIAELRRAIAGNELRLHYQPKVHFATGDLTGFEALVRWVHPKRGILSPDLFISLAEHTGLINPLTRWVVREATAQSHAWRRAGLDLRIAINFSAKNLQNAELTDHLAHGLSDSASREKLLVEVTESAIMSDELRAQEILRKLQDHGVEIAIDDFGTGYSSFGRLRELPVTELKIDKSFVQQMARSHADQIIVASIIELGHKLGLKVVAEGVETQSSWRVLSDLHCDLAQGYLLSRPMPAAEVLPWVRTFVPPLNDTLESDLGARAVGK
jgi:EAL domain-containing protein (putative c-di-GMP-specific phosphodiesterase class I)